MENGQQETDRFVQHCGNNIVPGYLEFTEVWNLNNEISCTKPSHIHVFTDAKTIEDFKEMENKCIYRLFSDEEKIIWAKCELTYVTSGKNI